MSTTIVITTHYIEEARQADFVGMMRFGRLLAENSPDRLLEIFDKPNLESVFLQLCVSDDSERGSEDEAAVNMISASYSNSAKSSKSGSPVKQVNGAISK